MKLPTINSHAKLVLLAMLFAVVIISPNFLSEASALTKSNMAFSHQSITARYPSSTKICGIFNCNLGQLYSFKHYGNYWVYAPTPSPYHPSTTYFPKSGSCTYLLLLVNKNVSSVYYTCTSNDPAAHSDISMDQVKAWRDVRLSQLSHSINGLPDSSLQAPAADSRQKLTDMVASIKNEIDGLHYHNAAKDIQDLENNLGLVTDSSSYEQIKEQVDGIQMTVQDAMTMGTPVQRNAQTDFEIPHPGPTPPTIGPGTSGGSVTVLPKGVVPIIIGPSTSVIKIP